MRTLKLILLTFLLCAIAAGTSSAKNKHKKREHAETHEGVKVAHLGIPPGHLPAPGECRVWYPGRPPGHQPPPGPCSRLRRPAGTWLIYRPDYEHVRVSVISRVRPGIIVSVRFYEAETGLFLHFESR